MIKDVVLFVLLTAMRVLCECECDGDGDGSGIWFGTTAPRYTLWIITIVMSFINNGTKI